MNVFMIDFRLSSSDFPGGNSEAVTIKSVTKSALVESSFLLKPRLLASETNSGDALVYLYNRTSRSNSTFILLTIPFNTSKLGTSAMIIN